MKNTINYSKPQISTHLLSMLLIFVLSFFTFSCSTEEVVSLDDTSQAFSIVEVLKNYESSTISTASKSKDKKEKKPTFKTLSVALAKTNLAGTVSSNQLTVFAPTDAAFAKYGLDQKNIGSFPGIKDILLYHAVAGKVFSTDLSNGFVPTLNGAAVEVKMDDSGVMINSSNVIIANIEARNGVIHAVDDILFPPTQNLVALASSNPQFSVLLAAATKAELAGVLMGDGPYEQLTVFAPTNQAFIDFLGVSTVDEAIEVVNSLTKEDLAPILLYHVVEGRVYSSDLSSGPVTTLNGDFDLNMDTLKINDSAMLDVNLLNIQATNGVIHVIKAVLVP
ncbi:fasciclin domain-containing protein [Thalassobellus suaedae]|uniref:Fasciclin domain-containing protein n=1 Tax=Thalassobellus suaedae TaxID=3074124 RepID=A0ABY9XXE1_9FLAO|nr:fasciclin domain-containing protein [Flavobacteriaceae bacterium HL-DH14]